MDAPFPAFGLQELFHEYDTPGGSKLLFFFFGLRTGCSYLKAILRFPYKYFLRTRVTLCDLRYNNWSGHCNGCCHLKKIMLTPASTSCLNNSSQHYSLKKCQPVMSPTENRPFGDLQFSEDRLNWSLPSGSPQNYRIQKGLQGELECFLFSCLDNIFTKINYSKKGRTSN